MRCLRMPRRWLGLTLPKFASRPQPGHQRYDRDDGASSRKSPETQQQPDENEGRPDRQDERSEAVLRHLENHVRLRIERGSSDHFLALLQLHAVLEARANAAFGE